MIAYILLAIYLTTLLIKYLSNMVREIENLLEGLIRVVNKAKELFSLFKR